MTIERLIQALERALVDTTPHDFDVVDQADFQVLHNHHPIAITLTGAAAHDLLDALKAQT